MIDNLLQNIIKYHNNNKLDKFNYSNNLDKNITKNIIYNLYIRYPNDYDIYKFIIKIIKSYNIYDKFIINNILKFIFKNNHIDLFYEIINFIDITKIFNYINIIKYDMLLHINKYFKIKIITDNLYYKLLSNHDYKVYIYFIKNKLLDIYNLIYYILNDKNNTFNYNKKNKIINYINKIYDINFNLLLNNKKLINPNMNLLIKFYKYKKLDNINIIIKLIKYDMYLFKFKYILKHNLENIIYKIYYSHIFNEYINHIDKIIILKLLNNNKLDKILYDKTLMINNYLIYIINNINIYKYYTNFYLLLFNKEYINVDILKCSDYYKKKIIILNKIKFYFKCLIRKIYNKRLYNINIKNINILIELKQIFFNKINQKYINELI
jgi:hypothetical protein